MNLEQPTTRSRFEGGGWPYLKFSSTTGTVYVNGVMPLQNTFNSLIETFNTKRVSRFVPLALWLNTVNKCPKLGGGEGISGTLLFPSNVLGYFCLKFPYAGRKACMFCMGCVQLPLEPKKNAVEFNNLGSYSCVRLQRKHALRNIRGRLDAAVGTSNPVHHDQVPSGEKSTHEG